MLVETEYLYKKKIAAVIITIQRLIDGQEVNYRVASLDSKKI